MSIKPEWSTNPARMLSKAKPDRGGLNISPNKVMCPICGNTENIVRAGWMARLTSSKYHRTMFELEQWEPEFQMWLCKKCDWKKFDDERLAGMNNQQALEWVTYNLKLKQRE